MSNSKKTESDVNEDLWISLQGLIDPINEVAQANDAKTITAPAPMGRITEQVVTNVKQDAERLASSLDAAQARELRSYITDLDDLRDEVTQFNTDTKTYMANVNYDGGVEDL